MANRRRGTPKIPARGGMTVVRPGRMTALYRSSSCTLSVRSMMRVYVPRMPSAASPPPHDDRTGWFAEPPCDVKVCPGGRSSARVERVPGSADARVLVPAGAEDERDRAGLIEAVEPDSIFHGVSLGAAAVKEEESALA